MAGGNVGKTPKTAKTSQAKEKGPSTTAKGNKKQPPKRKATEEPSSESESSEQPPAKRQQKQPPTALSRAATRATKEALAAKEAPSTSLSKTRSGKTVTESSEGVEAEVDRESENEEHQDQAGITEVPRGKNSQPAIKSPQKSASKAVAPTSPTKAVTRSGRSHPVHEDEEAGPDEDETEPTPEGSNIEAPQEQAHSLVALPAAKGKGKQKMADTTKAPEKSHSYSEITEARKAEIHHMTVEFVKRLTTYSQTNNLDPQKVNQLVWNPKVSAVTMDAWKAFQRLSSAVRNQQITSTKVEELLGPTTVPPPQAASSSHDQVNPYVKEDGDRYSHQQAIQEAAGTLQEWEESLISSALKVTYITSTASLTDGKMKKKALQIQQELKSYDLAPPLQALHHQALNGISISGIMISSTSTGSSLLAEPLCFSSDPGMEAVIRQMLLDTAQKRDYLAAYSLLMGSEGSRILPASDTPSFPLHHGAAGGVIRAIMTGEAHPPTSNPPHLPSTTTAAPDPGVPLRAHSVKPALKVSDKLGAVNEAANRTYQKLVSLVRGSKEAFMEVERWDEGVWEMQEVLNDVVKQRRRAAVRVAIDTFMKVGRFHWLAMCAEFQKTTNLSSTRFLFAASSVASLASGSKSYDSFLGVGWPHQVPFPKLYEDLGKPDEKNLDNVDPLLTDIAFVVRAILMGTKTNAGKIVRLKLIPCDYRSRDRPYVVMLDEYSRPVLYSDGTQAKVMSPPPLEEEEEDEVEEDQHRSNHRKQKLALPQHIIGKHKRSHKHKEPVGNTSLGEEGEVEEQVNSTSD
ncbi:hypothetical protein DL93DRAFT_2173875 [Clavulina sp. PMI_390]|nr:hypothetical protein DL93DRAFT_2173875 [Clavulina sp. PMI_390]